VVFLFIFAGFNQSNTIKMDAKTDEPVRAQMKAMKIGDKLSWPKERYDYIVNCRTRIQMSGVMRFSSTVKDKDDKVTIERIQDAQSA